MSKFWLAFENQIGKETRSFAIPQVDRQETVLSYVHVAKPHVRKCRELNGRGLYLRIRFANYTPKEFRLFHCSILMALEEFQSQFQHSLTISLQAHSSFHQSQVRDMWSRRETAQDVRALRLAMAVARKEPNLALQSCWRYAFCNAHYAAPLDDLYSELFKNRIQLLSDHLRPPSVQ